MLLLTSIKSSWSWRRISNLLLGVILLVSPMLNSCNPCPDPVGACADTVPTNEVCLAFFTSWFYYEDSNSCKLASYSGCSAKGFATEQECQECLCNK
jgi:hypothetical protein